VRKERRPWPSEIARDVDEEIASHLALRRDEYAARGLEEAQAEVAASNKFGNRDDVAEACRLIDRQYRDRQRWTMMLTDLRQDLEYALRLLRRSPGFAVVAILTLALGMGATTTIFTLANWALLRPVPGVRDPANVSVIWVGRYVDRGAFSVSDLSYPNLADASARLQTLTLGAYHGCGAPVAGGGQAARNVVIQCVTASYFDVLGVRMQLGRPFTAAEDTPPSPFLGAVISDRLWQSMFQRSPGVLEQTIDVAGVKFAILGVAPRGFHGTERLATTDLWLPGSSQPIIRHMPALRYDTRDGGGYYELVARLKPGASWRGAEAEMAALRAWLREQYPKDNVGFDSAGFHLMGPIGPHPLGRAMMQKVVGTTAFGASALVLLIACANVASLLTIKGLGRRHETAVRKALGAGRGRLLRQHITEGLLLWTAGGAGALVLLLLLRRTLDVAAIMGMGTIDIVPPIDWRVLAFTAGVSLVVGLTFSAIPAVRATRADAADTMRATSPAVTSRRFVGTSLAVFQLAAALTLLVGALLLVGTLRHLTATPLGFDPTGLHVFLLQPSTVGYGEAESFTYVDEFQRRLRLVPGVLAVSAGRAVPFLGSGFTRRIKSAEADPQARPLDVNYNHVLDGAYFSTVRIPVVRGRVFSDGELQAGRRGDARVVMLSEGLARRLFGRLDPIGRGVTFAESSRKDQRFEVVGVVGTARYRNLVAGAEDVVYEPAPPTAARDDLVMTVRAAGGVRVADAARQIATTLNPALPLLLVRSMEESIGRVRSDWDSLARLLGILAGLAAVLACIGLYGVVAHGVEARRREFGIRAALGASRGAVWRLVVRQTASVIGAGLALGLAGAYAFAHILSARLVGVSPLDPTLWSIAVGLLIAVAAAASVKPAFAAARVNVSETLRAL
jgi:putative ABC transport system permease protein